MQSLNADASVYTELQGLSDLRLKAKQNSPEAAEEVAKQFEALFMQMMVKSMREASLGEGVFDSQQSQMYMDMFDKQLAIDLSNKAGGLGIADSLIAQLRRSGAAPAEEGSQDSGAGGFQVPTRGRDAFGVRAPATADGADPSRATAPVGADGPARFDDPESFVRTLWPHAERAARRLGVDPRALLSQAALETGWGRAVIQRGGESSHNLFNIKADHRWDGERVAKQTLEYRDGVAQKETAQFRAYGSYAESFEDFVDFIQSSPRYQRALEQADDPKAFVEALHEAGYATDPAYSQKIQRIMDSGIMRQAVAAQGGAPGRLS